MDDHAEKEQRTESNTASTPAYCPKCPPECSCAHGPQATDTTTSTDTRTNIPRHANAKASSNTAVIFSRMSVVPRIPGDPSIASRRSMSSLPSDEKVVSRQEKQGPVREDTPMCEDYQNSMRRMEEDDSPVKNTAGDKAVSTLSRARKLRFVGRLLLVNARARRHPLRQRALKEYAENRGTGPGPCTKEWSIATKCPPTSTASPSAALIPVVRNNVRRTRTSPEPEDRPEDISPSYAELVRRWPELARAKRVKRRHAVRQSNGWTTIVATDNEEEGEVDGHEEDEDEEVEEETGNWVLLDGEKVPRVEVVRVNAEDLVGLSLMYW